jgi:hypothetical protein
MALYLSYATVIATPVAEEGLDFPVSSWELYLHPHQND